MKEKTIGILGGMGPEATADLFERIIKATPARRDQNHLRVIIDNNPKIPDRTKAIVDGGLSPLYELVLTARNLERAGADFIIIPCNAAHYFYEDLRKSVGIPILNMIELTANAIEKSCPRAKKAGIVATNGTVRSRIYDKALRRIGVEAAYPRLELQEKVMGAVYGNIKSGRKRTGKKIIMNIIDHFAQTGSDIFISGCTEVSLVLRGAALPLPKVDPVQILAEVAVTTALGTAEDTHSAGGNRKANRD